MGQKSPSARYADLSDRFRSLWTFYQFLGGVFKHQGEEPLPFSYDFQTLYRQVKELAPRPEIDLPDEGERELVRIERELARIRERLAEIESQFAPSQLRRFFDHLKRQDEKILFALVKFYLLAENVEQDSFDKLDILLTRLGEAPHEDERVILRDPLDLKQSFDRLAEFAGAPSVPKAEEKPLIEAVKETRKQIQEASDFRSLLDSQILDRYRKLKQRLGMTYLHPPILLEVVGCNIEAKNRFKELYEEEEVRILEDTNRILEIERYIDRNPNLAHEELRAQIDVFRRSRARFDSGRKEGNIKRGDIFDLRKSMQVIFDTFDRKDDEESKANDITAEIPTVAPPVDESGETSELAPQLEELPEPEIIRTPSDVFDPTPDKEPESSPSPPAAGEPTSIHDPHPVVSGEDQESTPEQHDGAEAVLAAFTPDPLIDSDLKKIVFGLEHVVWMYSPESAIHSTNLQNLGLEVTEVMSYRKLAENSVERGTIDWHRQIFTLRSAALRIKMEEELGDINRLRQSTRPDILEETLEKCVQTLERARDFDRRFQWFIDDLMFRGAMDGLEQLHRCRFRLLRAYSALWLDHHAAGGLTPL